MSQMVFQASRRQLVSQLSAALTASSPPENASLKRVLAAADAEVRRLEFWSDLKDAAESGDTLNMNGDGTGISGAAAPDAGGKGKAREQQPTKGE